MRIVFSLVVLFAGTTPMAVAGEKDAMAKTYTYKTVGELPIKADIYRLPGDDVRPVIAGTLIALFIRPHPIANLQLWYVQNVAFFFDKARLDVGNEILPPSPSRTAPTGMARHSSPTASRWCGGRGR